MMKFAVLLVVLVVSYATAFPFIGQQNNNPYNPYNLDDGQQDNQGNAQAGGAQRNEEGDTPDDDEELAAAGGQGAAGQGAAGQEGAVTTIAPEGGDSSISSSSSSEEDAESTGGGGTTLPPAGPIKGAGQAAPGGTGGSSNGDVNAVGSPIYGQEGVVQQQPGDTSTANVAPGVANPLNMKPQAVRQQEGRRAGAAVALTTMLLVAGVASVSVVAYKYKDAISARLGL